jgi:hypothetical protein
MLISGASEWFVREADITDIQIDALEAQGFTVLHGGPNDWCK